MQIVSAALDPIEKKPLARFHPGSTILSIGGVGCTMHCPWCQNHDIAQPESANTLPVRDITPEELVESARDLQDRGNIGVAYTYNEPLYRWKDVLECAKAVHGAGMLNVVVTNGLIVPDKLERLLPYIDAFNIDLKGFDQRVYDVCGGKLETVKETIERAHEDAHVEVTTLLIPGLNDDMGEMDAEAAWLAGIDPSMPLHLTRFFPRYKYDDRPPTPISTLVDAREVANRHLDDVLLGNV